MNSLFIVGNQTWWVRPCSSSVGFEVQGAKATMSWSLAEIIASTRNTDNMLQNNSSVPDSPNHFVCVTNGVGEL